MAAPALEIKNLEAWYGESHVLHGVDIIVQPGEVVTLLAAMARAAPPQCAPSWA